MTYKEWREARQAEANKLPLFFAFSMKQFEEELAKRGIPLEEAKEKVYRLGTCGGYYLKSDAEIIKAYYSRDEAGELKAQMQDAEFAKEAFTYEMYNHEYPINWQGDWDVVSCFGNVEYEEGKSGEAYLRDLEYPEETIQIYSKARREVCGADCW